MPWVCPGKVDRQLQYELNGIIRDSTMYIYMQFLHLQRG